MFQEKCTFNVFKSTFYSISFVSNFKSNTTMTSNTDRSRTVTLIAPTIDISPQKAVLTTQQCRQNVIKIQMKSNNMKFSGQFFCLTSLLTIHLLAANFLSYACAKYYENWLALDKVIAIIKGCPSLWLTV